MKVKKISTKYNTADMITKSLTVTKFKYSLDLISVVTDYVPYLGLYGRLSECQLVDYVTKLEICRNIGH